MLPKSLFCPVSGPFARLEREANTKQMQLPVPKDSEPDPIGGTNVLEVDAQGKKVQGGFFNGRVFKTVSWVTRTALDHTGCPQWIDTVVVSDTLEGANNGKNLVQQDPEIKFSSSSNSQSVTALQVDRQGQQIATKVFNYSLVRSIAGDPPPGQNAIATELWFSEAPIQEIIDNQPSPALRAELTKMKNRCLVEGGVAPGPNGGTGS